MAGSDAPRTLDPLTGIRLFGALHVVLFHFGDRVFHGFPVWFESMRRAGVPSVTMFFMMSGFILAYKYIDPEGRRRVGLRYFLLARLTRFYPIYLLALLAMVPIVPYTPVGQSSALMAKTAVLQALGLQAWTPQWVLTWNNPGWTISIDLFFYLVFPPLVIPLVERLGRRGLLLLGVALWLLGSGIAAGYHVLDPDGLQRASGRMLTNFTAARHEAFWLNFVKFNPVVRLPDILVGVVAGRLFQLDQRGAIRRRGAPMSVAAAAVVLAFGAVSHRLPWVLVHNSLLTPVFAVLLFGLAHGGGPVAWLCSRRPVVYLGDASFAIYILQWPAFAWALRLSGRPLHESSFTPGFLVGALVGLVAVSCLLFSLFERPLQDRLRRRLLRGVPFWNEGRRPTTAEPVRA